MWTWLRQILSTDRTPVETEIVWPRTTALPPSDDTLPLPVEEEEIPLPSSYPIIELRQPTKREVGTSFVGQDGITYKVIAATQEHVDRFLMEDIDDQRRWWSNYNSVVEGVRRVIECERSIFNKYLFEAPDRSREWHVDRTPPKIKA